MLGTLTTQPARQRPELLAAPVQAALDAWPVDAATPVDGCSSRRSTRSSPTRPPSARRTRSDWTSRPTAWSSRASAAGELRYAACMVLATTRADVNGVVRRHLDVRKASFAPMAEAVELTGMEYGGITPIGLPEGLAGPGRRGRRRRAVRDHRLGRPAQQDRHSGRRSGGPAERNRPRRPGDPGYLSGRSPDHQLRTVWADAAPDPVRPVPCG